MNIQVITGNKDFIVDNELTVSEYSRVQALDDFDINIIDLSFTGIWQSLENNFGNINLLKDFELIKKMVAISDKTKVIYVYPQDGTYLYYYDVYSKKYMSKSTIKNLLTHTNANVVASVARYLYDDQSIRSLVYEITKTKVGNEEYDADFHFTQIKEESVITKSNISNKPTTILYCGNTYITTLNICNSSKNLKSFVNSLFNDSIDKEVPEWIAEYDFGSDKIEHQIIDENTKLIAEAQEKIDDAEKKLEINNKYKSILFTNGDRLVSVVFEILEIILECSLSDFEDKKKEDFLLIKDNIAIIGEIKGVSTNVKNEHVSQLDVHYQSYLDKNQNEEQKKDVYAVLIINPLRDSELKDREPINTAQIDLAVRNGSLIIETATLLKMLELYQDKKLATNDILNLIITKKGLLKIEDFNKQ